MASYPPIWDILRRVPIRSAWLSGFWSERLGDELPHLLVVPCAKRVAHVELEVAEQAGADLAVGGETKARALRAEVARQRRDDADGARRTREAVVAGGTPAAGCVVRGRRQQLADALLDAPRRDGREDLVGRHDVVARPRRHRARGVLFALGRGAHRHELDEPDVQRAIERHLARNRRGSARASARRPR